jgi:hypothetical protein
MATKCRGRERERLIERLKGQAAAAAEGRIVAWRSDDLTPDVEERFWRSVLAFETTTTTDLVTELNAIGVDLREPDDLDDAELHHALWRIIDALATLRVFLERTDHLSDRQLYTLLLQELLPEEMPVPEVGEHSAWHIDVLGYDQPELYLKYYADERTREFWRVDFPDHPIPLRETLPHDRDRHLPSAGQASRE